jgi:S-formylglutathione hydrolase FrmB
MQRLPIHDEVSSEAARPRSVLLGLWLTALILSLLFSAEVSSWIVHDGWFSRQEWALGAARALDAVSAFTGMRRLHDEMAEVVAAAGERLSSGDAPAPALGAEQVPSVETPVAVSASPASRGDTKISLDERAARHRILLIGESSIQFYLGSELERVLRSSYRHVEVKRFGKLATSLVRDDVLDWHERAAALVREFRPDLVIANFGGNDAQNIVADRGTIVKFGTPRWDTEFASRVSALARIVTEQGARLVMIGMPAMRDRSFSRRMKRVNEIIRQEMNRLEQTYLSAWDLTVETDGEYKKAVTWGGATGLMRLADGKHYSKLGARFVVERLVETLERRFLLWPRDPELSLPVTRALASRALNQRASYLAYVPQQAGQGGARLPVLFLLHGSGGGFEDWAEHAHRQLQRLSSAHDLIIVTPEGGADGWYLDSPLVPDSQYESHIVKEVVPDVERALPSSRARAIAGLSAGGNGAIVLALKHPGLFRSASSMSGALDLSQAADRTALIERLGAYPAKKQLWHGHSARHLVARRLDAARRLPMLITIGSSDIWAPANRAFHVELAAIGVNHVFEETPGQHDWSYWAEQLAKHVAWHAQKLRAR